MQKGTVKFFNSTKGFGFIQPDSGDEEVFVHISAVKQAGLPGLVEGQKIAFELNDFKGSQAVDLQVLKVAS